MCRQLLNEQIGTKIFTVCPIVVEISIIYDIKIRNPRKWWKKGAKNGQYCPF